MKKPYKILLIILGVFSTLYILGNSTGIAKIYHIPTSSNEPGIPTNSFVIFSNLITPKKGDFICYNYTDLIAGKQIWSKRLCAIENDTLLISKGELFINGKPFDTSRNLQRAYKIPNQIFEEFLSKNMIPEDVYYARAYKGEYLAFLSDIFAKKHNLKKYRTIRSKDDIDAVIKDYYHENWNTDHFGPLIIPKGKVFVIGDNRENSQDSRSLGFIDKKDIRGTLFKIIW